MSQSDPINACPVHGVSANYEDEPCSCPLEEGDVSPEEVHLSTVTVPGPAPEDALRRSVAGIVASMMQGAALRCNPDGTLEEWERVRVQRTINDRLTVLGYPDSFMDRTTLTLALLLVHDFVDAHYFGPWHWRPESVAELAVDLVFLGTLWLTWRTHFRRAL